MQDVAIYGITGDPPHLGHLVTGWAVHAQTGMPVWYMPCYCHQFEKEMLDPDVRFEMVRLMTQDHLWAEAFSWEIDHKHNGTMYETLCQLRSHHPHKTFHLIIGMDNANIIKDKWTDGDKLIQEFPCVVMTRSNVEAKVDWFREQPHREVVVDWPISSSVIRHCIRERDLAFVGRNLPDKVWGHIVSQHLYSLSVDPSNIGEQADAHVHS